MYSSFREALLAPPDPPFLLLLTQGLLRAPKESIPTEVSLVKLWRHECCRVFADKLTTLEDRSAFLKELDHQTAVLGRAVLTAPQVTQFGEIKGFTYLADHRSPFNGVDLSGQLDSLSLWSSSCYRVEVG